MKIDWRRNKQIVRERLLQVFDDGDEWQRSNVGLFDVDFYIVEASKKCGRVCAVMLREIFMAVYDKKLFLPTVAPLLFATCYVLRNIRNQVVLC